MVNVTIYSIHGILWDIYIYIIYISIRYVYKEFQATSSKTWHSTTFFHRRAEL